MFSSLLRIELAKRRLNIANICELTGLSRPTVSKLINDENLETLQLSTIKKICIALNCEFEDIIQVSKIDAITEHDELNG